MIARPTAPIRHFTIDQLAAAISFAEQGGIAVHLERRRSDTPRHISIWPTAYRVVGGRDQLREWGIAHAQSSSWMRELSGEPDLLFFIVVGETARRIEAELGISTLAADHA